MIPEEEKCKILYAAMEAPTAGNQQLYTILDITDQELKDTLARTCDNQPFVGKAPMVLIFCADVLTRCLRHLIKRFRHLG